MRAGPHAGPRPTAVYVPCPTTVSAPSAVTRVKSTGVVKVQLDVSSRGLAKFGYVTASEGGVTTSA